MSEVGQNLMSNAIEVAPPAELHNYSTVLFFKLWWGTFFKLPPLATGLRLILFPRIISRCGGSINRSERCSIGGKTGKN